MAIAATASTESARQSVAPMRSRVPNGSVGDESHPSKRSSAVARAGRRAARRLAAAALRVAAGRGGSSMRLARRAARTARRARAAPRTPVPSTTKPVDVDGRVAAVLESHDELAGFDVEASLLELDGDARRARRRVVRAPRVPHSRRGRSRRPTTAAPTREPADRTGARHPASPVTAPRRRAGVRRAIAGQGRQLRGDLLDGAGGGIVGLRRSRPACRRRRPAAAPC